MTFLAHLRAQDDHNAQHVAECLSGLAGDADDLGEIIAHLHATLDGAELAHALAEVSARWREFRKSSPDRLT